MTFQDKVFDQIQRRYPRRADAVDALCQILNLSKDPVYRRLRGETPLTPDELLALSKHYSFSLDALVFDQSDNVVCSFNAFSRRVAEFTDYLENYRADLEQARRLPEVRLFYATAEIPVFSYMYMPELISFKLYVWGRTTWNLKYLRQRPFDFELVTPPVMRLSQSVLEIYNSLESIELWSLGIADNTLAQIEYHVSSGGFRDANDALTLCDKLLEWAAHTRAMAAAGKKFSPGSRPIEASAKLHLYHNEMVYTNNTVLIVSDVAKAVYSAFSNPNFIKSTDARLCDYMTDWFGNVIAKSTPISLAAEKNRDWFFKKLTQKIESAKRRIQVYIEENYL